VKTCFALGILCLVLSPALAQQPNAGRDVKAYYPLKEGAKWHFKVQVMGNTVKLTNQVAKKETIDGVELFRIETLTETGQVAATEHLRATDEGVFRHRFNGQEIKPPLCLLKNVPRDEVTWNTEIEIGTQKAKVTCKAKKEEVQVPAGKYQTITVTIEANVQGMLVTTQYWFAPNVGLVKQSFDLGGTSVLAELEKYEAGK
jgi:hypothetical protein